MLKKLLIIFIVLFSGRLMAQDNLDYLNFEKPGDPAWKRVGFMNGNRFSLKFFNNTQLSDWPAADGSEWPIGSHCKMNDGIALLIGSRLILDENGKILKPGQVGKDTLYYCQTNYREHQDVDPQTGIIWGLWPVPYYCNPDYDTPAMSDKPMSWPVDGWPDRPTYKDTLGNVEWNGFFGRGKTNADLESYFVVNDAQDQEYVDKYIPIHDRQIVDSLGNTKPWGGLGLRVGVRGFQWSNPLAKDIIFWHYDCTNMSENDLYETTLGFWVDNNISDGNDDEVGIYMPPPINMAYAYDENGVGKGGVPVGVFGMAYLESPGIATDNTDNDKDGIIDEKRDNDAGVYTDNPIEGPDGTVIDSIAFKDFYGYSPHAHWTGDEDQDWRCFEDLNGNGKYDEGEPYNDDVGSDGVGPDDENYYGPDPDGSECNGKPDQGEPNFGRTDKNESDQIGLTAFQMYPIPPNSGKWFNNDELMWQVFTGGLIPNSSSGNLVMVFSSGPFPIIKKQTERISMAVLAAWDFPYQTPDNPQVPKLLRKKKTVQNIYDNDYQFAKPPEKPTLRAYAGDGQVILTWDDRAEYSKDPYIGYVQDFEGYKIYKSTEPYFEEIMTITDGKGSPLYRTPIAQFDLKDGITGYSQYPIDGTAYWLGDDTGIQHYYIDTDVENGRTYYYAVVAYDFGYGEPFNLPPSENTIILKVDDHLNVLKKDKNVAIVTPHSIAAGFIPGKVELVENNKVAGTGKIIDYKITNPADLKSDNYYTIKFNTTYYNYYPPNTFQYQNDSYFVIDQSTNDTIIKNGALDVTYYDTLWTDIFDGVQLKLALNNVNHYSDDINGNGWLIGNADIKVYRGTKLERVPWDYDLVFVEDSIYQTPSYPTRFRGKTTFRNIKVPFFAINKFLTTEDGKPDTADLVCVDADNDGVFNLAKDYIVIGELYEYKKGKYKYNDGFRIEFDSTDTGINLPEPGNIYQIRQIRPFLDTDSLVIHIKPNIELDKTLAKKEMDNIYVVPNPYIVTNTMEPNLREGLNQPRRLTFNNLPAKCTIRIYTVSGKLVKTINVDNPADNGTAFWDLQTYENKEIAFGIYIYHVDAPGIGEKIGKFAIIK